VDTAAHSWAVASPRPQGRAREMRPTLCVAATNNAAQDRIGERGCHWLAVGEQCRFR